MPNDELRLDDPSEEPEQGEETVTKRRWWSPRGPLREFLRVLCVGFYGRTRKTPEPAEPEPSVADVAPASPDLTSPPVGGSIGAATSRTELSERARELVPRMKIPGAIFILGPPSWAVTRADLEWSEPSAALTLLWANGACTPVTVHFNAAGEVISWDRGDALCFADEYQLVPGEEFSCSQPDRAPLCGQ